ncbi:MAG: tetratricopeptide repeat protein [Lachnospiraceae bacterium]
MATAFSSSEEVSAKEAIPYFQKAIDKQTFRNPNPYHGECYFNLGLTLTAEGEDEKAFDAFYKATWSAETQSPAFYWLAALSLRKGDLENALDFAEKSLVRNWHNMKVRTLKASILRLMGQGQLRLPNGKALPSIPFTWVFSMKKHYTKIPWKTSILSCVRKPTITSSWPWIMEKPVFTKTLSEF